MTYYRLVRQARQVYDPDPRQLQQIVGWAGELFPVINPLPKGVGKQKQEVSGMPVERLTWQGEDQAPVRLLFLHGGAFVFGSPKTHRSMAGWLTRALRCETLVLDYPLAPKAQFPVQIDQVLEVYREWSKESDLPVVVAGDSAGGNLAVVLAQRLVAEGENVPAALLLFSPWLDLREDSAAAKVNQEEDSLFNAEDMCQYARLYAGEADRSNPLISPLQGETRGLPPVFMQGARNEFLWPDFEAWASRLAQGEVPFTLDAEDQAFHSWQLFPGYSSLAKASLERAVEFVEKQLDLKNV